jgi:hypothetical protein
VLRRLALLLLAALALAAAPLAPGDAAGVLGAQRTRVQVQVPSSERLAVEGPQVRAVGILSDARLHDLMRNGFPTRLHFRLELWSDEGIVNDLRGTREWEVIVRYDALDRTYKVYESVGNRGGLVGRSAQLADAREVAERWTPVPLIPRRKGRYYYSVVLDVETLSLGDLDELERWLRGELRPAARNPVRAGNALTRGARTLVARLLGGERAQYQDRSDRFHVR